MRKIILHKHAVKFFKNAGTDLDLISKEPCNHPHIKKLKGELKNMYRFRLGEVRIIYEIESESQTVRVKTIDTRGSVYKQHKI